jgi:phage baseplate assembly protein W
MKVVEFNQIDSIMQNVKIILTTPKGTDIHRPDFGSNLYLFIDRPMTAITRGKIMSEIADAIEEWEPRVKVRNISLNKDYERLLISIELEIKETGEIIEIPLWLNS